MKLTEILRDSNYKLSQFEKEGSDYIERLEKNIFLKKVRGKEVPFINCLVRKKDIQLKPEEAVRQLYLMVLNEQYGYSFDRMEIEYAVSLDVKKNVQTL